MSLRFIRVVVWEQVVIVISRVKILAVIVNSLLSTRQEETAKA